MKVITKSITSPKLAPYFTNHPVATLLVEAASLQIKDANRSASRFFALTKNKLQRHLLADFCNTSKLKISRKNAATSKSHGQYQLSVSGGAKLATIISYSPSEKSKYSVVEFHEESEESFGLTKVLFEDTKDSTVLIAPDFKILAFNKTAAKVVKQILNKSLKEGMDFLKLVNPARAVMFNNFFTSALAGKEISQEALIPYLGSERWFQFSFKPVLNSKGAILGIAYIAIDIHDKKVAQELVDKKESQLLTLTENLPNAVIYQFWLSADGEHMSFPYISSGAKQVLGISPQEIIKDYAKGFAIVHPEDVATMMKAMHESRETLHLFEMTNRNVVNGQVRWVNTKSKPRRLKDGSTLWDGVTVDITDAKLLELELKTKEEEFKNSQTNLSAIVENSDTAYVLYDLDLRVILFNRLANQLTTKYFGKAIEVGTYALDYFLGEKKPTLSDHFDKALKGQSSSYEVNYGTVENPLYLFKRIFPVQDIEQKVQGVILALTDITLIKASQSKLDRSQKLYESLVKSQTSFLIRTDMLGYYTFVNQSFLEHFGFIEQDVLGKHSFETIHQDDLGICERAVRDCMLEPGKVVKAVFRKPNKDGKFFWTEWEFVTIQNEMGELTEIQCLGYNVTEKLEAEKRLVQLANRLSVATQAASLGIWEIDPITTKSIWDKRMYEMFGVSETTEVNYETFKNWVHPDDLGIIANAAKDSLKKQTNFIYRIFRQNDQALRYVQAFGLSHPNSDKIIGVNLDVTERILMENKLAETASRLKLATESAKMGVWEWDLSTNIISWDALMDEIYGMVDTKELSFSKFASCIVFEDRKMVEEMTIQTLQRKIPIDFNFRIIRQTDKAIRTIKSFGIFDSIKNSYTGVNLDVTDFVEKEKAIARAKSQIEQLQTNALRSAMNPHFIFNALNSIQYFITQNQRENAIGYLSKFSKLIRGILDSSSNQKSTLASELDLIRHYVEIEQLRFEHKFDFQLTVSDEIDLESIDLPPLLIQPFVENAVLHGLYTKKERGLLKIKVEKIGRAILVSVTDNGIGRVAALALRKAKFPDHQSRGLSIIEDRTRLLGERSPIHINVIDQEENSKATGTQVEILLQQNE